MSHNDEIDDLRHQIGRLETRVEELTQGTNDLAIALSEHFARGYDLQQTEPLEWLVDALDGAWRKLP